MDGGGGHEFSSLQIQGWGFVLFLEIHSSLNLVTNSHTYPPPPPCKNEPFLTIYVVIIGVMKYPVS